ncbi:MAG: hypothetical protein IPF44_00960 [Betaproteobacteria bacterium]|nr:hypothetical protein [Betaproteobacteria bacterium]
MSGWTAATYLAAGSLAVGVGSAVYSGQQQKQSNDTQAQIAENNAAYSADSARAHAEKIRKAGRAQQGTTKVALAASGVKLAEGTALEVDKSIIQNSEQDALSAILSGDRALKSGADEAGMLRASGQAAQTDGYMSATGTALSGAFRYSSGKWTAKK